MSRSKRNDPAQRRRIHEEMLEHLREHPPTQRTKGPTQSDSTRPRREKGPGRRQAPTPARPRLMLRRLRAEMALARLEEFVRFHRNQGKREVVVIVGKGRGSAEGRAVLGPAVQKWCRTHPTWVRSCDHAPPEEGGEGALVLRLHMPTCRAP